MTRRMPRPNPAFTLRVLRSGASRTLLAQRGDDFRAELVERRGPKGHSRVWFRFSGHVDDRVFVSIEGAGRISPQGDLHIDQVVTRRHNDLMTLDHTPDALDRFREEYGPWIDQLLAWRAQLLRPGFYTVGDTPAVPTREPYAPGRGNPRRRANPTAAPRRENTSWEDYHPPAHVLNESGSDDPLVASLARFAHTPATGTVGTRLSVWREPGSDGLAALFEQGRFYVDPYDNWVVDPDAPETRRSEIIELGRDGSVGDAQLRALGLSTWLWLTQNTPFLAMLAELHRRGAIAQLLAG